MEDSVAPLVQNDPELLRLAIARAARARRKTLLSAKRKRSPKTATPAHESPSPRRTTSSSSTKKKKPRLPIATTRVEVGQDTRTLQLEPNATLVVVPNAVRAEAHEVSTLQAALSAKSRLKFKLYGKECTMQRHQAIYGIPTYTFSGKELRQDEGPMPALVAKCLAYVAGVDRQPTSRYWALVNWYPDARDFISAHSDDEKEIGIVSPEKGPTVATFSFGSVPRVFRIGRKPSSKKHVQPLPRARWDVPLPHGSCAIMTGTRFQPAYTHEVLRLSAATEKAAKAKATPIGRLSVTVRAHPQTVVA